MGQVKTFGMFVVLGILFALLQAQPIVAQDTVEFTLFVDRDYLVIYLGGNQEIQFDGIGFEVANRDGIQAHYLKQHATFKTLSARAVMPPLCIRLYRHGSSPPLPLVCQDIDEEKVLEESLLSQDIFWYNTDTAGTNQLVVTRNGLEIGICEANHGTCDISYQLEVRPRGISLSDLNTFVASTNTVGELINELNAYFDSHPGQGESWESKNPEITGAAVFWTDIYENVNNLPSSVIPLRNQNGWGVFFVEQGVTYQIPSPNSGGKYLPVIIDEASPTPIPTDAGVVAVPTETIPSGVCRELSSEDAIPSSSSYSIAVEANSFHIWTSGDVCITSSNGNATCLRGGENQGNVLVMLPENDQTTTYQLSGLVPNNNWHGTYVGCFGSDQQARIDTAISGMHLSPNCSDRDGCENVEVLYVQGQKIINRLSILTISSQLESGFEYVCSVSGQHRITIIDGAYNPFGESQAGWWRTILYIFLNSEVAWDGRNEPSSQNFVGNYETPNNTFESAQQSGKGQYTNINCNAGDKLRVVTVDTKGSYTHQNTGSVTISVQSQLNTQSGLPSTPSGTAPISCSNPTGVSHSNADRKTYTEHYTQIYQNCGWEATWNTLVQQGTVAGLFPTQRAAPCWGDGYEQNDNFSCVTWYGIDAYMLDAQQEVVVRLPHCITYNPSSSPTTVTPSAETLRERRGSDEVTTNVTVKGHFTLFLWCVANWEN